MRLFYSILRRHVDATKRYSGEPDSKRHDDKPKIVRLDIVLRLKSGAYTIEAAQDVKQFQPDVLPLLALNRAASKVGCTDVCELQ